MNLTTSQLKRSFMKMLYEDEIMVQLIDDKTIEYPDDLIGTHIFPRLKVDFTEQEVGSYIGLKIDYPDICTNELYKNYILTLLFISHNGHSFYQGSNRVDLMGEESIKLFNWNEKFGFRLELKSDREYVLDKKYYARELMFASIVSNGMVNGVKQS